MASADEFDEYIVTASDIDARVVIGKGKEENIPTYSLKIPRLESATVAFMEDLKVQLLKQITISSQEALDIKMSQKLKDKFSDMAKKMITENMPHVTEKKAQTMCGLLVHDMLGLGDVEFLLNDNLIEEVCINSSTEPVWIYHRKHGWIKTDVYINSENQIWNYSSSIARRIGRQINTQNPLLDAYLPSGDRVNATLYPISSFGNTITIRKFARKPWTITDYINSNTITSETAALLWLAIQYETNIIVSGGTGAGKTSLLNVLTSFMPINQRVVSIEQTREITLPAGLQWVPLVVREATSEGSGNVSMLDLMVNALRMRPDRIIVGEIRRAEEAQVLFEAMHTGHSVYATLHAETADETLRRLTHEPINIPSVMMESLHLVVPMYRDRRTGRRRVYEIAEIVPTEKEGVRTNLLYRWRTNSDKLLKDENSVRILNVIKTYANMDDSEIRETLEERKKILDWLVKKDIKTVDKVGGIISRYYSNPDEVLKLVRGK